MKKILFSMCLMATAVFFSACKDDDDEKVSNAFTVGGTEYALSNGYVDSDGDVTVGETTYHLWNIALTSDGITYAEGFTGTGSAVRVDLYTTQDGKVPAGTYSVAGTENGIEDAMVFVNFNLDEGTGTAYSSEIEDAEVIVKTSGDDHTITFTLTLDDDSKITGSFKGQLSEVSSF